MQLDRDFSHYQDIMGWYNKRPSLWVEPRNKWGKGTIGLMEIPTTAKRWITLSASGSQKKL
ncbi:glucans biosynthesis protein D [Escherichia coli]|uniref:Glucans biosynthesis protein D n=1 Tax=Escherichia coli TaxID=562 RepID=A0A2X3LXI8_ECOLX|nr:glucans biosynthesis protein D [Escherichia coli]